LIDPTKLKEYFGEEEWENFQPNDVLSPDVSCKIWNNIDKSPASPKSYYSYFKWIGVAASVVLVVVLSWLFILKKQKTSMVSASTAARSLTLSDGSIVDLLPNSTLSYPESYNSSKRDVILNGEATFNIAKDVTRPFSVTIHSVLITVLGTRFTVHSYEAKNATKVILQEGKVMVKVRDSTEYFLTPGDIFISNDSLSARILHLEKDKDDHYVFNNYPLDVVFDQLQIIYNTKIIYNKAELGNRTFIGKIDKKDPLSQILTSITLLTNFGLHKQGDGFIIGPAVSPH
jgi:ferric-dicitrate binding protein FerR (iron transport regulator)